MEIEQPTTAHEKFQSVVKENMLRDLILFVCEHGVAKSILAAAYFNKLAAERNLNVRAIARGTKPDQELSPATVEGLERDGLRSIETRPQKLTRSDIESAQRVISFCELPEEYAGSVTTELWDGVPPIGEDYETARDVILKKLKTILE